MLLTFAVAEIDVGEDGLIMDVEYGLDEVFKFEDVVILLVDEVITVADVTLCVDWDGGPDISDVTVVDCGQVVEVISPDEPL